MATTQFSIPSWNLEIVQDRVANLARKAERAGMSGITLRVIGERLVEDRRIESKEERALAPKILMVDIEIDGEPKLDGWKFVGVLDLTSVQGEVIVRAVPGQKVPSQYFHHAGSCDHCNKIRIRNETFVVENEDGVTQAVGRTCLKDFLGHSPFGLVGYLNHLGELFDDLNNDEYLFGGGERAVRYHDLTNFLLLTAAVIRIDGWVARSAANPEQGRTATADNVMHLINGPSRGNYRDHSELVAKYAPTEQDAEDVELAVEWVKAQAPDSEFIHNLQAIVRSGVVSHKNAGYAAAIVSFYQRARDKLNLSKSAYAAINNEYVGEVGDKIETVVVMKSQRQFDNYYGTVWMHEFIDNDGHVLIWMASGRRLNLDVGDQVKIKGTIKQHKMYGDMRQTYLIRVKVTD